MKLFSYLLFTADNIRSIYKLCAYYKMFNTYKWNSDFCLPVKYFIIQLLTFIVNNKEIIFKPSTESINQWVA